MKMITYFNDLVTKNFNNYLKKYFNFIDYTDKNGNFINYYNFINDLDSFNDSFMKDVIKYYFEYIDECFFNSYYRKKYCKSTGFYERIMLLYLAKYHSKEDTIMIIIPMNISSLLICFWVYLKENILTNSFVLNYVINQLLKATLKPAK